MEQHLKTAAQTEGKGHEKGEEDEEYGLRKTEKTEREEHEKTHLSFRSWCRHCVRGKGKEEACKETNRGHEMAEVHMDSCS